MAENEIIKYIGFIDDEKPQYVLLMTKHKLKSKMIVRLLKIKKELDRSHEAYLEDQIVREQMESIVKEKLING